MSGCKACRVGSGGRTPEPPRRPDVDTARARVVLVALSFFAKVSGYSLSGSWRSRWLRRPTLERYERSDQRSTHRSGCRDRVLETRAERVNLKVPKLREGSYFPNMLEPRRRAERALVRVTMGSSTLTVSRQGLNGRAPLDACGPKPA